MTSRTLAFGLAALAVVGVAQAETLYWTGASDGAAMFTAGNWALVGGATAAAAPKAGEPSSLRTMQPSP